MVFICTVRTGFWTSWPFGPRGHFTISSARFKAAHLSLWLLAKTILWKKDKHCKYGIKRQNSIWDSILISKSVALTWGHFSVFVPKTGHCSGLVSIPTLCCGQLAHWPITNTPLVTVTLRRFSTSPGLGYKSCFKWFFRTRNSTMCSELKYRPPAIPHTVPTTCLRTKWPFTRSTQFTVYRTRCVTLLFQRWSWFTFTKWFVCGVTWLIIIID